jgi:uncharacterized alkaline shock family protein YloU
MTGIKTNANTPGHVRIADEVIAVIAGTAALEAEGVAGLAGHIGENFAERLGRKYLGKGVTIKIEEGAVSIATEVCVKSGAKIQDVGREVQDKIKNAVETMTGLTVAEVNVSINALAVDKVPAGPHPNIKKPRKA